MLYTKVCVFLCSYANSDIENRGNSVRWTPLTGPEFAAFLAVFVAMGINCLPAVDDYWSDNPIMGNSWIKSVMTRNRFRVINRYTRLVHLKLLLHFLDYFLNILDCYLYIKDHFCTCFKQIFFIF